MPNQSPFRPLLGNLLPLATAVSLLVAATGAQAYTPESPEVKQSIERALTYLQNHGHEETRVGGRCLIGLCFLKNGRPVDHPMIQAGIKACQEGVNHQSNETYSPALALIYLCELEDLQPGLRDLAQAYVEVLVKRQQTSGAWGYLNLTTVGDTSQTQYGALAMWMAANHGHEVPQDSVERMCGWLVRTQDPSGTWSYQGQDPGGYTRVNQHPDQMRLSLHVGGVGSLYMAADMLGIINSKEVQTERKLPPALRAVGKPEETKRRASKLGVLKLFDAQLARTAIADGDRYFAQKYTMKMPIQLHYYLYGLERYQSFKELAAGRAEREPKWYNDGCEVLFATQDPAVGYWPKSGDTEIIATCFSVLFLARSSHKAIAKINPNLGDGVLLGGMGLPPNTADLVERDGKVVETPLAGSIDELLAMIEKPNAELDALVDTRKPLALDGDITKRAGQVAKLRSLVSAGNFNARLLAVRTLARSRELDNAPLLIYALSDPIDSSNPDCRIVVEADRGLRFLSRKFAGVGLSPTPKLQEQQAAIAAWKDWYKSVRPDAEFLD
jgi:hypothetical protein